MDDKEFEYLKNIADICASKKRILILYALSDNPFLGYGSIKNIASQFNVVIGSSELYKHANVLIKHGLIEHIENKFIITDKGKEFVIGLNVLLEVFDDSVEK